MPRFGLGAAAQMSKTTSAMMAPTADGSAGNRDPTFDDAVPSGYSDAMSGHPPALVTAIAQLLCCG